MMVSSSSLYTATFMLFCVCVCSASFSWSNCGTQLQAGINYVEVSVSPSAPSVNGTLSLNIQATIVSQITNANTYLTVWKDGTLYLSVQIQDLCTIVITSTNSLACPIPQGDISFTYTFSNVPALVTGNYKFKIQSVDYNDKELGCLAVSQSIGGLVQSTSQCEYTSSFSTTIDGTMLQSLDYNYIQVGPYGNVPAAERTQTPMWGTLLSFVGTSDVGGTIGDLKNYVWGVNATQVSATNNSDNTQYIRAYGGVMFVGYTDPATGVISTVFTGTTNWTIEHNIAANPVDTITGYFVFNPLYSYPSLFMYPVVLGNLGPFKMTRQVDGKYLVSGARTWCTCGYDACGRCGGDDTSCLVSISTTTEWTVYRKTAVGVGVGGGFIGLVAIVALFFVLKKTKKRNQRRHDDQDLIDTPEKPDYGTLAIDEVIQEGDRV